MISAILHSFKACSLKMHYITSRKVQTSKINQGLVLKQGEYKDEDKLWIDMLCKHRG
jgi:hypothetical protein